MEEILKTTLLEYEKSAFIIDLVKHHSGNQYIRILQTIRDEESEHKRAIKINPSLLSDIVKVLNSYSDLIPVPKNTQQQKQNETTTKVRSNSLTESEKTAIQNRYLKGVSISDLTLQFDCKAELIEQILNNNGIEIVDNKLPKSFNYKKIRRGKR
jgi:hypothetical protein